MWQIQYEQANLVSRHQGTLPVLIACPHNGAAQPDGVPERSKKKNPAGCEFEKQGDLNTRDIATALAQRVLDVFGEAPYVVIAEFHRKYLDANRSRRCAYQVDAAQPFYDEYHDTLRAFVDRIRTENRGLGLLFDIHGTTGIASDPAEVYLGTDDGKSIARLLSADPQVMSRGRSLRGFLQAADFTVSMPASGPLSGGFTVETYGSSNADGIDAIQLEVAKPVRDDPADFVEALAFAAGNLARLWVSASTP